MQCEICGRFIERGKRIRLEGSIVVACSKCADCGEAVGDAVAYPRIAPARPKPDSDFIVNSVTGGYDRKKSPASSPEGFGLESEKSLIDDYSHVIRETRESMGLKQEELAMKINQPKSLVHRIESGRFEPKGNVVRKIEKVLGIKLLSGDGPDDENRTKKQFHGSASGEMTLGDMVVIKKRVGKEE